MLPYLNDKRKREGGGEGLMGGGINLIILNFSQMHACMPAKWMRAVGIELVFELGSGMAGF